ncbi:MAG: hypothetical protein J6P58_05070, partial [Oscillospiraceae bacterium]|nr:hypothetical protein [Oscillospiraceae bacterium]
SYPYTYVLSLKYRQWFKIGKCVWQDDPAGDLINTPVTPLFFLTGVCGMRLSEECLSALTRGDPARRKTLILGQSALWGFAFAAAVCTYYLLAR